MSGCSSCNTCENSLARGCGNFTTFNWLEGIAMPQTDKTEIVEVSFKQDRKEFFTNPDKIAIKQGDIVAVEATSGHDIGVISLTGELVLLQMKRKNTSTEELKKVYRIAKETDIEKWNKSVALERSTLEQARIIVSGFQLDMKLSNVEYQADGTKATFYYTAESRVDFRELVKSLSKKFMIRIEMRQIGLRQEAAKLGGIGSCGRELCCSSWISNFASVNTAAVRYQQLAINPQKISGQCGKLKCCLNYELDSYLDALKDFPPTNTILLTKKGKAKFFKMDVFKKKMWFEISGESHNLFELPVTKVNEIIAMNKQGLHPEDLSEFVLQNEPTESVAHVLEQDNIHRFDKKNKKQNAHKKRFKKNKPRE